METPCPKVRAGLDFFPLQHEGHSMICLRDPMEIAQEPILVPPHAFFVLAQLDGDHTIDVIQDAFFKQFGQRIGNEQIEELVAVLDAKFFMDGPSFQARLGAVQVEFNARKTRAPALAGQSYPDDPEELGALLDRFFEVLPDDRSRGATPPSGIIAPHIDLHRGGALFAHAYDALRGGEPPHTVLILGTAHCGDGSLFTLCPKDFETPRGISPVDHDFCSLLTENCSFDLRAGELAHRTEHSIELQVLFIQHLFKGTPRPRIVPVLCGPLEGRLESTESPLDLSEMAEFIEAVNRAKAACPGPVLLVSGADLSHVGRKFGMDQSIDSEFLNQVSREDRSALEAGIAGGPDAFHEQVARIGNRNNICSVTSIYTLWKVLSHCVGELIAYDQAEEPDTDSAVGFAALNFRENP